MIRYSYDGLGNRVQQDISQTYTLWETETKQVQQRMKKLEDKLAFLDEHDYCIACFYGESDTPIVYGRMYVWRKTWKIKCIKTLCLAIL